MVDKNEQNTESIISIVEKIEKKDIVLPDFQRDFVWEENKTYELFDSLVRDIFIGSIIYGIPSFQLTVRELDTRARKRKGKRREKLNSYDLTEEEIKKRVNIGNFRVVLDGQQRMTSIFRALRGMDNVWFVVRNDDELENYSDVSFNKLPLENVLYEFAGTEDISRISLKLSDIFTCMEEGYMDDEVLEIYYNKLNFSKSIDDDRRREYERRFLIVYKKLQDLFKAQKLVSYFLLDMNSEKFALFFERSNSLGVQLNFIDILVAKLNRGFRLRDEIERLNDKNENRYDIEREVLVRGISYIVSGGKKLDKGYILSNLTHEDFTRNWDKISKLYIEVVEYLFNNSFIISQDWMPHNNMIIPMMIFLDNLPNSDFSQMTQNQKEFLHYWYWASIFAQRYGGGATNETIIEDSSNLSKVASGEKITDRYYLRKYKIVIEKPEELYSFSKKGSSVYKGILNIINYNASGILDWNNNSKIKLNSKIDDHHIFPKKYILDGIVDEDEESADFVDTVANRTLIPKITNIKIGKKPPSRYMNELYNRNEKLKECLESHLIPVNIIDGSYDKLFSVFLNDRCKKIYEILKKEVVDKEEFIKENFYEEPKRLLGVSIQVYGKYKDQRVTATFNRDTNEILFNGEVYSSVSKAANQAKKYISGKEIKSENGWKFWKYYDGERDIAIDDFRNR